jgi:hypothetical protein
MSLANRWAYAIAKTWRGSEKNFAILVAAMEDISATVIARSEATKQSMAEKEKWIASRKCSLAMTLREQGSRPQHILMHLAGVEMEKRHRRVVFQRAGGKTFFQFIQDIPGHGVQIGQRF